MKKTAYILDGNSCKTKQDVFDICKELFEFPTYFSENWDGFEEILYDYFEVQNDSIVIIESSSKFLEEEQESKSIIVSILKNIEENLGVKSYFC